MGVLDVWLLSTALFILSANATVYRVGGEPGWRLGVNYTEWTSRYTFQVGDTLVFSNRVQHSVLRVSESDYLSCNLNAPLEEVLQGEVVISSPSAYYFVCGVPGHCVAQMKFTIVTAGPRSKSISAWSSSPSSLSPLAPASLALLLLANYLVKSIIE